MIRFNLIIIVLSFKQFRVKYRCYFLNESIKKYFWNINNKFLTLFVTNHFNLKLLRYTINILRAVIIMFLSIVNDSRRVWMISNVSLEFHELSVHENRFQNITYDISNYLNRFELKYNFRFSLFPNQFNFLNNS